MKKNSFISTSPDENIPPKAGVNHQAMVLSSGTTEKKTVNGSDGIELPTFPDSVFEALPMLLQKVVARSHTKEDRDMMLLGSMVTLGSCLTRVFGKYGGKKVYPNLFFFVTAPASAGKGNLVYCRQLVSPVHEALREQAKRERKAYKTRMRKYNVLKWKDYSIEKPDEPQDKMLFIPADNSASGVFQLLYDNDGRGLIFETEGDTLANAFQSDYSNYSDGLRKAFHHEMISFHRRTEHEHVEIKAPCISLLLSGTPRQVASLIPSAENGLFSRFLFYHMIVRPEWKDMIADSYNDLEEYFDALGKEFFSFYNKLNNHPEIQLCLTPEQHKQFNVFFTLIQEQYLALQGTDYIATIRRLALIAFRLFMILTALRIMESGNFSQKQDCLDSDFQRALSIIRILVQHSSRVFSELPEEMKPLKPSNKKREQFFNLLPEKFTRLEFIEISKSLPIPQRSAELYIANFCDSGLIVREQKGVYRRLALSATND